MMYWKVETFFRQNLQEAISCYQFVIYPKGKSILLESYFWTICRALLKEQMILTANRSQSEILTAVESGMNLIFSLVIIFD